MYNSVSTKYTAYCMNIIHTIRLKTQIHFKKMHFTITNKKSTESSQTGDDGQSFKKVLDPDAIVYTLLRITGLIKGYTPSSLLETISCSIYGKFQIYQTKS